VKEAKSSKESRYKPEIGHWVSETNGGMSLFGYVTKQRNFTDLDLKWV